MIAHNLIKYKVSSYEIFHIYCLLSCSFSLIKEENSITFCAKIGIVWILITLFVPDNENLNAEPIYDYTFKHYILDAIEGRKSDLDAKKFIVFKGRALRDRDTPLQIALVLDDGSAYGGIVTLTPKTDTYVLELSNLRPVKTVTLPRPYPSFLPYYFEHNNPEIFDINRIESIQFSLGPGLNKKELKEEYGLSIISLWLE